MSIATTELAAVRLSAHRYYALFLLALIYLCNTMDKMIVAVLIEPIKLEFGLSDGQMGLIAGLSFAAFNAAAALPLGWVADRFNRRNLIAACLAWWSLMTAACGQAQTFSQLVIARIGVGIGEAGGPPASVTLVADLFPRGRRATATSVLFVASSIGAAVALGAGGWVGEHYGWRTAMQVVALPGLLLSILVMLTLREPRRGEADGTPMGGVAAPSLRAVCGFLLSQRSILHVIAGVMLSSMVISASGNWSMSFFVRSHGVSLGEIGPMLAAVHAAAGLAGTATSGIMTDTLARRDIRWWAWTVAVATAMAAPLLAGVVLAPTLAAAIVAKAAYSFFAGALFGPTYALCQNLVPPTMRGTTSSILYVCSSLIGYGLGTQIVGTASDLLAPTFGHESLRVSILLLSLIDLWAALHLAMATRTLRSDLQRAGAATDAAVGTGPLESK